MDWVRKILRNLSPVIASLLAHRWGKLRDMIYFMDRPGPSFVLDGMGLVIAWCFLFFPYLLGGYIYLSQYDKWVLKYGKKRVWTVSLVLYTLLTILVVLSDDSDRGHPLLDNIPGYTMAGYFMLAIIFLCDDRKQEAGIQNTVIDHPSPLISRILPFVLPLLAVPLDLLLTWLKFLILGEAFPSWGEVPPFNWTYFFFGEVLLLVFGYSYLIFFDRYANKAKTAGILSVTLLLLVTLISVIGYFMAREAGQSLIPYMLQLWLGVLTYIVPLFGMMYFLYKKDVFQYYRGNS